MGLNFLVSKFSLSLDGEILIAIDQDKGVSKVNSLVILENIFMMKDYTY